MYICGKNVVREYLSSDVDIKRALVFKKFDDTDILENIKSKNIFIKYVEKYELDKLVSENHQGIIIEIEDFEYTSLSEILNLDKALVVMLDHIQDPHNLGAIIRTCEAAGVNAIIIPKDRSVAVNGTVIRTSVGASKYVPIIQVTNLSSTIRDMKKTGYWFFGTDMDGEDYTAVDYNGKSCLIIGNEGKGLGRLVKEDCDFIVSIPMYGEINSLNASVATGIVIYEAIKVRNKNGLS